jgi:hypothetical protein
MFTSHRLYDIGMCFYALICVRCPLQWLKENPGVAEDSVCGLPADYFTQDSSNSEEGIGI